MKKRHDKRPGRVGEPVQVYLAPSERSRLARLEERLDATKSDVIRKALESLERDLSNHSVLRLIGLADDAPDLMPVDYDVAVEHDRFLADSEIASWKLSRQPKSKRRAR